MRLFLTALPLLALAAPAAAQYPYEARGTEPFWSVTINKRAIRFEEAAQRPITALNPVARRTANGVRYIARGATVDVTRARCSDGMSDNSYPDTVTMRVGRRTLKGCGGAAIRPSRLADTKWTVWTVNDRPIQTYAPLTVTFAADKIGGKLCNGFGGDYTLTGDRLRAGRIMSTQMLCQGPSMIAESTLLTMLRGTVTATIGRDDVLTLASGRDTVRLRRDRR